jgi:adenylosuccinate synthase
MMKVDVLDTFDEINVCTHYKLQNGTLTDALPFDLCSEEITPVYKTLKGWNTDLTGMTEYKSLPAELKEYVNYLEEELKVPINIVSVGPNRKQTIFRSDIFQ